MENRAQFRAWLEEHGANEAECWVKVRKGRPRGEEETLWYLDAVEEALCFGWIDSTNRVIDGIRMQRFTPRKKNSPWTELNKARVRRLEALGKMTEAGRAVLPDMNRENFRFDAELVQEMKSAGAWEMFCSFPPLYQRVKAYNTAFYKKRDPKIYRKMLDRLLAQTLQGKMYGDWDDYGRLKKEK